MTGQHDARTIGYRSPVDLIATYGNTRAGRERARAAMREQVMAEARRQSASAGLTKRCRVQDHKACTSGHCLCECHDEGTPA